MGVVEFDHENLVNWNRRVSGGVWFDISELPRLIHFKYTSETPPIAFFFFVSQLYEHDNPRLIETIEIIPKMLVTS